MKKQKPYKKYSVILDKLEKIGFIELYNKNNKKHITFADASVRSLLTKEGEMLETHIYNLCVTSGLFDDVATGYVIKWESGDNITNEFDMLATSGLKSAFVEMKSTADNKDKKVSGLKQDYYEKLESLDCKFGINSSEFLINDMADGTYKENIRQIERGNQFEITTILDDKIKDAPKIIYEIMNSKK